MPALLDFYLNWHWDGRPFLFLGKGPSFRTPTDSESQAFNILTLNQTVRECKADIAMLIDMDVVDQLGSLLYDNAVAVCLPYHPHLGFRPWKEVTLLELSLKQPTLRKLREEGRLYGFNLSTWKLASSDSPMVEAIYYSAEAAVSLVSNLGCKEVRTLGIDGGKAQSPSFSDLPNLNTHRGYDLQWPGIRKSIAKHNLDFASLGTESPIRVFIGAGLAQLVPALVLKHSILKHVTMSCDVTIMNEWQHPMPRDAKNMPRTPFSFQRFMIPEKCGYKGHALYFDSDMLSFADVREIWQAPMQGEILAMRNDDVDRHRAKFSVIKFDCSKVLHSLDGLIALMDSGKLSYEQLVFEFKGYNVEDGWNPDWNSLEEYTAGKTKLLHYTEMWRQVWWVNHDHPLGHLWFAELKEAVSDGSIDRLLIEDHVAKRWLLPKCLEVLDGPP